MKTLKSFLGKIWKALERIAELRAKQYLKNSNLY
jgi:hypothetical protein